VLCGPEGAVPRDEDSGRVNLAIATDQKADIGGNAAQCPTISNTLRIRRPGSK
jgi:hypothetical protein